MCTLLYINCEYSIPNEIFTYFSNLRNDYNNLRSGSFEAPYGNVVELITIKFSDSHKQGEELLNLLPCYLKTPDEGSSDPCASWTPPPYATKLEQLTLRIVTAIDKTRRPFKMIFEKADKYRNGFLSAEEFGEMLRYQNNIWVSNDELEFLVDKLDTQKKGQITQQRILEQIDFRKKNINQYMVNSHDFFDKAVEVWQQVYDKRLQDVKNLMATNDLTEFQDVLKTIKQRVPESVATTLYVEKLTGKRDSLYERMIDCDIYNKDPVELREFNSKKRRGGSPTKKK